MPIVQSGIRRGKQKIVPAGLYEDGSELATSALSFFHLFSGV